MNLIDIYNRTKEIIINPDNEWIKIKNEVSESSNINSQILILFSFMMALGALIGSIVFNVNNLGSGLNFLSIFVCINAFLLSYAGTYLSAYVFNELMNNYAKEKDFDKSLAVVINALIPYYIFSILAYIIPQLGIFFTILGLFSIYLLWLGIKNLTDVPQEKRIGFLVLSSMIGVLIFFLLRFFLGSIYLFVSTNLINNL